MRENFINHIYRKFQQSLRLSRISMYVQKQSMKSDGMPRLLDSVSSNCPSLYYKVFTRSLSISSYNISINDITSSLNQYNVHCLVCAHLLAPRKNIYRKGCFIGTLVLLRPGTRKLLNVSRFVRYPFHKI